MKTVGLLLACLLAPLLLPAADSSFKPVVLHKAPPFRSGTEIREKRTLLVERGRSQQTNAKETSNVSTRYSQRLSFLRKVGGAGVDDLRVSEFMTEWSHFTGPTPPPNEQPSPLMAKTLRTRKTGPRWEYELSPGDKPTPEERQTLDQLALQATLLDVLPICIGTMPHKVGDSWKTEIPAPRGKASGYIVVKDIACTFVKLDGQADGALATVRITGRLSMERPLGYNSRIDITFEAILLRRLTDMLDVDTKITGTYLLKGEANIAGTGKTLLDFDYPFTLSRTQKIEPK